jgi:hypothetical protein
MTWLLAFIADRLTHRSATSNPAFIHSAPTPAAYGPVATHRDAAEARWRAHFAIWMIYCVEPSACTTATATEQRSRYLTIHEILEGPKIPAHNTSGTIGVSWDKRCRKWAAHITLHQKKKHLGLFIEKSDAIAARMSANLTFGFHKNHGRCV